jgi:acyl carrier protein
VKPSTPEAVSVALAEILRDDMNVDIRRVTPDSRLVDDVGLDSVAFAVGMVAIEDRLGVALSEEDLLSCETSATSKRQSWRKRQRRRTTRDRTGVRAD